MYEIPSLSLYVRALHASIKQTTLTAQKRKEFQGEYDFIKNLSYTSRGTYAVAMIFAIDWKKPASFMRRQVPIIVFGCLFSIAVDFWSISSMWSRHGTAITKYTALKDGVFFKPEQLQAMRQGGMKMLAGSQIDARNYSKSMLQVDAADDDQQMEQDKKQ